jgi:hypothetical protein
MNQPGPARSRLDLSRGCSRYASIPPSFERSSEPSAESVHSSPLVTTSLRTLVSWSLAAMIIITMSAVQYRRTTPSTLASWATDSERRGRISYYQNECRNPFVDGDDGVRLDTYCPSNTRTIIVIVPEPRGRLHVLVMTLMRPSRITSPRLLSPKIVLLVGFLQCFMFPCS